MSTFRQKVQATTNWVKPDPEDLVEAPRRQRRAGKRRSAPVTAHHLFPAFAALWFAALFGLGSLAIPGALLGRVVLNTGLPAVLPAAAPPLGTTAHVLIAFALAMFGAALGLALALRLRPQSPAKAGHAEARRAEVVVPAPPPASAPEAEETYKVRARDAHPDAPPRRPLVLTEALVDPFDAPGVEAPAEFEPEAPLLRRKRSPFSSEPEAEPAAPWIPEFTPGGQGIIRPLDLSALDLEDPIEQPFFARPDPVATEVVEAPEPQMEAQVELEAQPEAVAEPAAPVLIAATPQLPAGFTATLADTADGKWSPVAGAPLENLGLVQLVERLALAIAEQKAANEAVIAADAAAGPAAAGAAAAPQPVAEEIPAAPEFEPGPFSQPQIASPAADAADAPAAGSAREALLRRLGAIAAGEPVEPAANPSAARPFTRPAPAAAPTDAVVPIRPAEAAAPAVSLPATAPMAPVEADEALRSALATLQRMTARG